MNEPIPEELPPALKALVAAEQRRPRPPDEHTARLLRRLHTSFTTAPIPAVASKWWLHTLVGFCLGVPTGAVLLAALTPSPPAPEQQIVLVEQPQVAVAEVSAPPLVVSPPDNSAPPRARALTVKKVEVEAPVALRTNDAGTLEAERQILEGARIALSRGNTAAALDGLVRHKGQFPHGALSEERDALWVQALVNSGQTDAAKQHAARFRAEYPESFLRPLVDLASPP